MNLVVLLVSLATCLTATQGKLFVLNNTDTGSPCILVDVDFTLDLVAIRGEKVIKEAVVSSDDEDIRVGGSCGDISAVLTLFFPGSVNWGLKFEREEDEVFLNKLVQFIPNKIFGKSVPISDYQLMDDPGVLDLGNATYSYECPVAESVDYEAVTVTATDVNFTVTANVSYIHAQAFNVDEGDFSFSVICKGALSTLAPTTSNTSVTMNGTTHITPSTTITQNTTVTQNTTITPNVTTSFTTPSSPNVTVTSSIKPNTTAPTSPTTTSSPDPPLKLYTVKDGNTTCIAMQAALILDIKYPVGGEGKTKMAQLFVPQDAESSGNCKLSATAQELVISFFKDWQLKFLFRTTQQSSMLYINEEKQKHPKYTISQIELVGTSDMDKFPGTTWPVGQNFTFKSEKLDFPYISSSKDYYRCHSTLKTRLSSDATIESQNFEVKAFNDNDNEDFSGSAAVCAADSGNSKKTTYVIVGCVLAAIVLIAFIAFVVMRMIKKRRENYESI